MKNILVCDDAMFMRNVLKDILVKNGYNIVGEACNGIEAIRKAKDLQPDIITLDITMPVMDGITALKNIRKEGITVPIIMCSAMGQQCMVVEAIESGANDFIVKPFDSTRVLTALEKMQSAS